ncbi:MAG: DNA-processing protein DprA [Patescibacteria group bacterium]|nr:DNA-processing protein DprA [Patescibacteria group bacterium]
MEDTTEIRRDDALYPPQLAQIPDAPKRLFVRGRPGAMLHEPTIAVVGTRKLTPYGEMVTRRFVRIWAAAGLCVVSGLALGIDALAHKTTLDANGLTVAVLGGGVDPATVSPRTNARLAERIIAEGGAVISEYPPGTIPHPGHFPTRNRIVAGLARAVIVIEGSMKSGTLITAKAALEYQRDVFAVPGPVTHDGSAGANWLIAQGAYPLTRPEDVLERFGLLQNKAEKQQKIAGPAGAILKEISRAPATPDRLCATTGLDTPCVLTALSELEIEGLVIRCGDEYSTAGN